MVLFLQIVYSSHALRRISYATCEPSHKLVAFLSREPRSPPHLQHCHAFRWKNKYSGIFKAKCHWMASLFVTFVKRDHLKWLNKLPLSDFDHCLYWMYLRWRMLNASIMNELDYFLTEPQVPTPPRKSMGWLETPSGCPTPCKFLKVAPKVTGRGCCPTLTGRVTSAIIFRYLFHTSSKTACLNQCCP